MSGWGSEYHNSFDPLTLTVLYNLDSCPFRDIIYGIQIVVLFSDSLFKSPHYLRKVKFN